MPKIVILEDSGSTPGVHTTLNERYYIMNKLEELQKKRDDTANALSVAHANVDVDANNDDLSLAFDRYYECQHQHVDALHELEDYMSLGNKDYVVVTAISSYRMRYVMHRDDLQKLNPKDTLHTVRSANDTVTMELCEEFSQEHMGEYIIDTVEMDEAEMLALFDRDNEYRCGAWPKSKVVAMVRSSIPSVATK